MTMDRGRQPDGVDSMTGDGAQLIPDELDALLAGSAPRSADAAANSWVAKVLWALASVPTVALGLLLSMAVRVRLQDGVWPVRNQPDPKDLGIHNTVTLLAILGSFVVVLLVPVLSLVAYFTGPKRRVPASPPLVAIVGFAVLVVVLVTNVGGLGDWFAD